MGRDRHEVPPIQNLKQSKGAYIVMVYIVMAYVVMAIQNLKQRKRRWNGTSALSRCFCLRLSVRARLSSCSCAMRTLRSSLDRDTGLSSRDTGRDADRRSRDSGRM